MNTELVCYHLVIEPTETGAIVIRQNYWSGEEEDKPEQTSIIISNEQFALFMRLMQSAHDIANFTTR